MFTAEQNKKLCEVYPYLIPKNVWTGKTIEGYDYSYIEGFDNRPWQILFLLYCKRLKPMIGSDSNFYFMQIKEKYGTMRLYSSALPCAGHELTSIYEVLSEEICPNCGKRTKWVTTGWITYLCNDCSVQYKPDHLESKPVRQKITLKEYTRNYTRVTKWKIKEYLDEFYKCLKMTNDEFLNYLCDEGI